MAEEPLDREVQDGWIAMIQHYFVTAWVPSPQEVDHFYSRAVGSNTYVLGMTGPLQEVAPGESATFASELFVGPKIQDRLKALAPGLELTVDYGWLTVIAQPLFWLLKAIHGLVGNWGWSIILLTVLIKAVFFKLSETSYKSMANMRRLQPRMTSIREKFAHDKQKMNQAMMELYKKEKINPMGGCLPIVVQIPVFIALYWMLLESVELRMAPFMLWIQDLSAADPFYVLPLLMGASMFIQQRLNPAPPDPIQAKVMMALPVVFTVFFLWFPSGLVLYWLVNNILSISQQWVITRRIEKAAQHA
jgi:YidC/Oxa1 family membrane protein insertase